MGHGLSKIIQDGGVYFPILPQFLCFFLRRNPCRFQVLLSVEAGIAVQVVRGPWQDDLQGVQEAIWQGAPHIDDLAHLTRWEILDDWKKMANTTLHHYMCMHIYI